MNTLKIRQHENGHGYHVLINDVDIGSWTGHVDLTLDCGYGPVLTANIPFSQLDVDIPEVAVKLNGEFTRYIIDEVIRKMKSEESKQNEQPVS
jgi:hypothetical protein